MGIIQSEKAKKIFLILLWALDWCFVSTSVERTCWWSVALSLQYSSTSVSVETPRSPLCFLNWDSLAVFLRENKDVISNWFKSLLRMTPCFAHHNSSNHDSYRLIFSVHNVFFLTNLGSAQLSCLTRCVFQLQRIACRVRLLDWVFVQLNTADVAKCHINSNVLVLEYHCVLFKNIMYLNKIFGYLWFECLYN